MIKQQEKVDGIIIGLFVGINDAGEALVAFADNPKETAMTARSTVGISGTDIGREVALMFENGDLKSPLIIGFIQHRSQEQKKSKKPDVSAKLDDEEIVLSAKNNIILKCGKSSITLTKTGKILIRGEYLLSRSSGVNRIKGGSVQIN